MTTANAPIQLVFTLDRNFVQHCAVTLASIFANNKDERFVVHIVFDQSDDRQLTKLRKFIAGQGHSSHVHFLSRERTRGFKISHHVTSATYYRLFLGELLAGVDRVLYLDSDIIVTGLIRPLWDTLLDGCLAAAIRNGNDEFFNGGVLLLDLDLWRKRAVTQKCLDWIDHNNDNIRFWDQDVLNAVMQGEIKFLSSQWNCIRTDVTASEATAQDVRVIHYVGVHKPWNYYCEHPMKGEYFRYLRLTPWKNFKMKEETYGYKLRQGIKKVFLKLNA